MGLKIWMPPMMTSKRPLSRYELLIFDALRTLDAPSTVQPVTVALICEYLAPRMLWFERGPWLTSMVYVTLQRLVRRGWIEDQATGNPHHPWIYRIRNSTPVYDRWRETDHFVKGPTNVQ